MEKMVSVQDAVDSRDVYTPPRVVKISDLKQGAGDCTPGSGDSGDCLPGNNPSGICYQTGSGDVVSGCSPSGSVVIVPCPKF
jgi:hypothetical protein